MEIDVTHMVDDADNMIELSGSCAEHGQDAGRITWNNSLEYARTTPLLKTDEERDAARKHFKGYGAWDAATIDAWAEDELQGITCQEAAASIREMEGMTPDEFERACERGTCSGRLSKGDDGKWYLYLGE